MSYTKRLPASVPEPNALAFPEIPPWLKANSTSRASPRDSQLTPRLQLLPSDKASNHRKLPRIRLNTYFTGLLMTTCQVKCVTDANFSDEMTTLISHLPRADFCVSRRQSGRCSISIHPKDLLLHPCDCTGGLQFHAAYTSICSQRSKAEEGHMTVLVSTFQQIFKFSRSNFRPEL